MIDCTQCRDEMAEFALGSPDAALAESVAAHLAACPVCRQEYAELQAAWAALPRLLAPVAPSPELLDRIQARIDDQPAVASTAKTVSTSRGERVLSWALAASVLVALTAGLWRLSRSPDDEDERRSVARLAERLGKLQQMERVLASQNVRLASLKPDAADGAVEASVVWDLAARQWHVYVANLPAPPADRQYQVWAADEHGVFIAGPILKVNDQGLGSVIADLPQLEPSRPAKVLVTLEPAAGSQTPTGKVLLEASL